MDTTTGSRQPPLYRRTKQKKTKRFFLYDGDSVLDSGNRIEPMLDSGVRKLKQIVQEQKQLQKQYQQSTPAQRKRLPALRQSLTLELRYRNNPYILILYRTDWEIVTWKRLSDVVWKERE